jgi:hypothetical protein
MLIGWGVGNGRIIGWQDILDQEIRTREKKKK